MSDRTSFLVGALEKQSRQSAAAKRRRRAKRSKSNPGSELHVEWTARFKQYLGDVEVPPWGVVEKSLALKMVAEMGFDGACALIIHYMSTWDARQWNSQRERGDVPTMKNCWNQRQKMLAEMNGTVKTPVSKRSRMLSDEWDEESAANDPDVGW